MSDIWVLYIFICKSPSTSTINHHFSYYECSFFYPNAFYRGKNVKNTTTFCSEPPLLKTTTFLTFAFYAKMAVFGVKSRFNEKVVVVVEKVVVRVLFRLMRVLCGCGWVCDKSIKKAIAIIPRWLAI
jgi:hypothetical protein